MKGAQASWAGKGSLTAARSALWRLSGSRGHASEDRKPIPGGASSHRRTPAAPKPGAPAPNLKKVQENCVCVYLCVLCVYTK